MAREKEVKETGRCSSCDAMVPVNELDKDYNCKDCAKK